MRVALISLFEPQDDEPAVPRGVLQIFGRSVAQRQIDLALDLACERIICLSEDNHVHHLTSRHTTEQGRAGFFCARSALDLSGLVCAADDLFVFADGVLIDQTRMRPMLAEQRGIITLSAAEAVPMGFERIDAAHAWAGALRIGGDAVEKLASLPSDIEPVSALLRVALQSGIRATAVPDGLLADGLLTKLATGAQAAQSEASWIRCHFRSAGWTAPGSAMADRVVVSFSRTLFDRGVLGAAGISAVFGLIATAFAADWIGGNSAGFAALALAAFVCRILARLSGLHNTGKNTTGLNEKPRGGPYLCRIRWARSLLDLTIILLPSLPWPADFLNPVLFAGIMLMGLLHLVEKNGWTSVGERRVSAIAGDRAALCLVLAASAFAGILLPVLQALGLVCLGFVILRARANWLTRA